MSAPLSPRLKGLKLASRALVEAAGGLEAAALFCRLGKTQLGECVSVNHPTRWLPLDVVQALEAVTEGQIVSRYLARQAGFALVALPDEGGAGAVDALDLAGVVRTVNDVVLKLATAVGNGGAVDAREVCELELVWEIDEAIDWLTSVRARCLQLVEGA